MQKPLEKKLNCKFIRIDTSRIHTFISNSNKKQNKKNKASISKSECTK